MPTYDYECKSCHHRFELFQSMSDPVRRKCPKCGKATLERLIGTGAAVIFKGSGFYQTDYRTESYKKSADADKKPAETKAPDAKPAEAKAGAKTPDSGTSGAKPDSASKSADSSPAPKAADPKPTKSDPKSEQHRPTKGKSKR